MSSIMMVVVCACLSPSSTWWPLAYCILGNSIAAYRNGPCLVADPSRPLSAGGDVFLRRAPILRVQGQLRAHRRVPLPPAPLSQRPRRRRRRPPTTPSACVIAAVSSDAAAKAITSTSAPCSFTNADAAHRPLKLHVPLRCLGFGQLPPVPPPLPPPHPLLPSPPPPPALRGLPLLFPLLLCELL